MEGMIKMIRWNMKYRLNKTIYNKKLASIKTCDKIKFHNHLVDLLDVKLDSSVLDLGCGHGNTLLYIVEKLGSAGKVVGIDIDEQLLAVAEKILFKEIKNGKLELVLGDISKELPLKDSSYDRIVCHNVLECIPDKILFINNCYGVLRKGGVLIMSHTDWDSQIYNSSFTELSRKLSHNYADTTQDWMEASEGALGRKLNGLFKKTKFNRYCPEVYTLVNYEYSPKDYGYRIAKDITKVAKESKKFSLKEIQNWLNDLKKKDKKSDFYYSSIINIIVAKK